MSTTPLMSEFPVEKDKAHFPIDESDVELTVGQPAQRRCFWARLAGKRCRHTCADRKDRKFRFLRFIKVFFLTFLGLAFIGHLVGPRVQHHFPHFPWPRPHPIICVPITDSTTTVELPLLTHFTHIGVHPSLTANDTKITHSSDVKAGHVSFKFTIPDDVKLTDSEEEPELFACHVIGRKFVGVGVHPKAHHKKPEDIEKHFRLHHKGEKDDDDHPKHPHHHWKSRVSDLTITLPEEEAGLPRGISFKAPFWHPRGRHGRGGCHKKRIRAAVAKALRVWKAGKTEEGSPVDEAED